MPENTDAGWPLMTDSYQTNTARGRRSYERFWGGFQRVTARVVSATPPSRVRATLTYYLNDGRVMTEATVFELVEEEGALKIDDSTVLSSSTR